MSKEKKIVIKETKEKVLSDADLIKLEIAEELGLIDKINKTGWKSLTARESGKIGGVLAKRLRERNTDKKEM